MKLYGSFQNRMNEQVPSPEPEVGMGATIYAWSDRYACTVIEVVRFKNGNIKGAVLQRDHARRIDGKGMTDSGQRYEFVPNLNGIQFIVKRMPDGRYKESRGNGCRLGERVEYRDFSF